MVDLPATVGTPAPPVKVELGRELMMFWLTETFREASPRMTPHSLSGARSIVGVSTGAGDRVGTRQKRLRSTLPRVPWEVWHPQ